jgi:hypothetical protein
MEFFTNWRWSPNFLPSKKFFRPRFISNRSRTKFEVGAPKIEARNLWTANDEILTNEIFDGVVIFKNFYPFSTNTTNTFLEPSTLICFTTMAAVRLARVKKELDFLEKVLANCNLRFRQLEFF